MSLVIYQKQTLKFYRIIPVPLLVRASNSWTLRNNMTRMKKAEMRLLRAIAGYRLTGHKCSEVVKKRNGHNIY
jgi:hypothetical protein